ncbi:hypothetical protein V8J82_18985 [Gymnodinialimonas sp. 2305UL16-5]|uniref:hypothetical protein n=1 Tax=Gymnodinialimonas mytili TaxID=3126503 RepID=UPI00309B1A5C
MLRFFFVSLVLIGLAACTPTTTTQVAANGYSGASCFSGDYVFDLDVNVPTQYGGVQSLAQYANGPNGLEFTCDLVADIYPVRNTDYPIYRGEVYGGGAGLCAVAQTTHGGELISCASQSQVARSVSTGAEIRLSRWQPLQRS